MKKKRKSRPFPLWNDGRKDPEIGMPHWLKEGERSGGGSPFGHPPTKTNRQKSIESRKK